MDEEEEVVPAWEPEPRSKTPTKPIYQTYGPDGRDGQSWHEFFLAIRDAYKGRAKDREADDEEGDYQVIDTGLHLPDLEFTTTQKDVIQQAELAGFEVNTYRANVRYFATHLKNDGKTGSAGDVTNPEVDLVNTFIEGRIPGSVVAFKAAWVGRAHKFSGAVSDPIGRYVDVPGILAQDRLREVQWGIAGSKQFQAWIDEWRGALTGITRAMEKSTKVEEAAMRKSLAAMKKEMME